MVVAFEVEGGFWGINFESDSCAVLGESWFAEVLAFREVEDVIDGV